MRVFLLKSKGKGIVPDYIQVRDDRQSIIGYFKAVNLDKGLDEIKIYEPERREKAATLFRSLEYGKMIQADL